MPKEYSSKKDKQTANVAKEPETSYYSASSLYDKEMPSHVKEDIRMGMEQYSKGEYRSVSSFMSKYGK